MAEQKFTPRAENVLRLAQETALELGHGYVGCEHILLGLLREDGSAACRALGEAGVTEEQLREQLVRTVGHGLSGSLPSQGLTPRARSAVEMAVAEAMRFASPRPRLPLSFSRSIRLPSFAAVRGVSLIRRTTAA